LWLAVVALIAFVTLLSIRPWPRHVLSGATDSLSKVVGTDSASVIQTVDSGQMVGIGSPSTDSTSDRETLPPGSVGSAGSVQNIGSAVSYIVLQVQSSRNNRYTGDAGDDCSGEDRHTSSLG
jgi:hypothetical protein